MYFSQATLQKAAEYKTVKMFACYNPEEWAKLVKNGMSRQMAALFSSGEIYEHKVEKVDKRLKENREGVRTQARDIMRAVRSTCDAKTFFRKGGVYAKAAKARGMEEEIEAFYARDKTIDEVMEQVHRCHDLVTFAEAYPHYHAQAKRLGLLDYLERFYALPPRHEDLMAATEKWDSIVGFADNHPYYYDFIVKNGLRPQYERHFQTKRATRSKYK